jgi:pimeloyl-ACP methyl ester carboxylesterase
MAWQALDKFWHQTLKRPYILARPIDEGRGDSIILLHGIGRTAQVWKHLVPLLHDKGWRVTALDLLGFGRSPKPDWLDYSIDDHTAAVIATLEKIGLRRPAIIVGHSMGCLVAVRVARQRPDLVKHLVLYEMPLYEGLPHKRSYRLRTDLYYRVYSRIMAYKPTFDETAKLVERLGRRIIGQEVTPETWQPFIRSLKNTIMNQTTAADIKKIKAPMDVIYGRFDMFVIGGHTRQIFGVDTGNITSHTIRARHVISPSASQFIAARIFAAQEATIAK